MKIKEGVFTQTSGLIFPMVATCVQTTPLLQAGERYTIVGIENSLLKVFHGDVLITVWPERFGIPREQIIKYMSENGINQDTPF